MSKPFSEKIDKHFDASFSSTCSVLSRFRVFLSNVSSKTLQKTCCKKRRVETFLQKNRQKFQGRIFLDVCYISRFWAFLREGVQKHDNKSWEGLISPGTFMASEEPTNHQPRQGPSGFFLEPLGREAADRPNRAPNPALPVTTQGGLFDSL
jgi:hypothetical protein